MDRVEENPPTPDDDAGRKTPLTEEFGIFVKETLEKWKVPGMSLAVIDGEDVYAEVGLRLFYLSHHRLDRIVNS
jgi:hypothetical protein